jgi:hypothetical protein
MCRWSVIASALEIGHDIGAQDSLLGIGQSEKLRQQTLRAKAHLYRQSRRDAGKLQFHIRAQSQQFVLQCVAQKHRRAGWHRELK